MSAEDRIPLRSINDDDSLDEFSDYESQPLNGRRNYQSPAKSSIKSKLTSCSSRIPSYCTSLTQCRHAYCNAHPRSSRAIICRYIQRPFWGLVVLLWVPSIMLITSRLFINPLMLLEEDCWTFSISVWTVYSFSFPMISTIDLMRGFSLTTSYPYRHTGTGMESPSADAILITTTGAMSRSNLHFLLAASVLRRISGCQIMICLSATIRLY